jgi:hypothetical protein
MNPAIHLSEPYTLRSVRFLDLITFDDWRLKLYGIAYQAERPEQAVVEAAIAAAQERLPRPAITDDRYGVGFLAAHQGRRGATFTFVDWWAGENDLYQHAWHGSADAPGRLRPSGPDDFMACTSDLAVIAHERSAWVRHVLARPEGPDLDAYLADRLDDDV